ncbi:MAG: Rieske 2Fe-2S domain-containing protein, partial [Candidatus Tectomicrobia bacterium]
MKANIMVKNAWYALGLSNEFEPGHLHGQKIVGKPIVLWRTATGKVVAFDDRCAHKRMPLSEGKLLTKGDVLECAYHGFCYNAEGVCVGIPSMPDGPIPPQARLKAYPVIEQDGVVWIWPGHVDKMGEAQPPRTPEIAASAWESISSGPLFIRANTRLLIENLLDITHFYPLHDGNIGDFANSQIPIEVVEETIDGNWSVKSIRRADNYQQPPYFVDWFGYEVVDRFHTHCMMNPGVTRVELRVAPPGQLGTDADRGYVLYHTHTPVDESNHIWRWCMNCRVEHRAGSDPSKSLAQRITETFPAVVEEDRWALEKQQAMFAYPDDGYEEVLIGSDETMQRA